MDRKKPLPDGMMLYPKAFRGNRIIVQDQKKQEYGHLSFGDDRLYFCMIPFIIIRKRWRTAPDISLERSLTGLESKAKTSGDGTDASRTESDRAAFEWK